MNFSVVIPTYKRERDLTTCLDSLLRQTRMPVEVVVIDDDALPDVFISEQRQRLQTRGCLLVYYKKNHERESRGTSVSRNIGMSLAKEEIVFILDDDLVLEKNFCAETMSVWEKEDKTNLIGVGGIISNNRKKTFVECFFSRVFGLDSSFEWDVTDVGFQVWDDGIQEKMKGYYAHGGACSYRKSVVKELGGFTVLNIGRNALEDVEFSLRAKSYGYHYIMNPNARTLHNHALGGRATLYKAGLQESQNRKIIFRSLCKQDVFHRTWFLWSSIGWILRQVLIGHFKTAFGMIVGFFSRTI